MKGKLSPAIDGLLAVASTGARWVAQVKRPRLRGLELEDADWQLIRELGAIDEADARSWRPLGIVRTEGDSLIVFLGDSVSDPERCWPPAGTRAVLKSATSQKGISVLERSCRNVARLKAEPRLVGFSSHLPEILAVQRSPNAVRLVEKLIPGEDGRTVVQRSECRLKALSAAKTIMADLHACTASAVVIGDSWLEKWISRPSALLEQPIRSLMSSQARRSAAEAFAEEQRVFWRGRVIPLGWCHGDFSPGNILFNNKLDDPSGATKRDAMRTAGSSISGIVDWDRAETDAPPGFDACHLEISARREVTGEEFGKIVCELLSRSRSDKLWGNRAGSLCEYPADSKADASAFRALVGLVWMHQVTANLEKSSRYARSRLWASANVERVLQIFL
jgi:hypothetical protein